MLEVVFPVTLYPAVAPLPAPMANHLLHQEQRKYRRRPTKCPPPQDLIQTVLERILRARTVIYEYLRPFVLADKKRQREELAHGFPSSEWLLDELASYAPNQVRNADATLDYWQQKGLLRREKVRGALDITSVAALLIARIAEEIHQKNWLPSSLTPDEPWWWCYGRKSPSAPIQAIPVPIPPDLPSSLVLWTPWLGAIWEGDWQTVSMIGDGYLYRGVTSCPTLSDLRIWDEELADRVAAMTDDALLGREVVQTALRREAGKMILAKSVRKGFLRHDQPIGESVFHQP